MFVKNDFGLKPEIKRFKNNLFNEYSLLYYLVINIISYKKKNKGTLVRSF